jgi:GTP-binding protein
VAAAFPRPWRFLAEVPTLAALPPAGPPEVAFAGRSNVGKSSLINALVGQAGLARTSNTPGRTQALVFFVPEPPAGAERKPPRLVLVDMPGYGYAKAPKDKIAAWTELVRAYLRGRPGLRRVFLLVDARHGLKPADETVMRLLDEAAVSYQLVLTKADKVKPDALTALVAATAETIRPRPAAHPEVLVTSAAEGHGLDALRAAIAAFSTK